jgi:hypothetical protein
MPLTERQWSGLARDLRKAVAAAAPEWTDSGSHDPGITVLELLAYALSDLSHRHGSAGATTRAMASEVTRCAALLARGDDVALDPTRPGADDECGSGLTRVRYFGGRLLGVDDFNAEQHYLLDRLSRRNRWLHGAGVVAGLDVTATSDRPATVEIAPGLAFDALGREICVDAPCRLGLPATGAAAVVQIAYRERPCRSVATGSTASEGGASDAASNVEPTRIAETFSATVAAAPSPDAIALARVRRVRGRWRLDASFVAARVRR